MNKKSEHTVFNLVSAAANSDYAKFEKIVMDVMDAFKPRVVADTIHRKRTERSDGR